MNETNEYTSLHDCGTAFYIEIVLSVAFKTPAVKTFFFLDS